MKAKFCKGNPVIWEEIILEENFSELLEKSLTDFKYKEGQIVKGTVLSIVKDTVVVDVGLKSEGRIPLREFHSPGEEHNVKIGDKLDVYLEKLENKEGEALLSREKARKEESWTNLEKSHKHLKEKYPCTNPVSPEL